MKIHLGRGPKGFEGVSTVEIQEDFYKVENEIRVAQPMRLALLVYGRRHCIIIQALTSSR
ncbi:hypothetical protein GGI43DRAFT_411840 [Trichoderma evansii]